MLFCKDDDDEEVYTKDLSKYLKKGYKLGDCDDDEDDEDDDDDKHSYKKTYIVLKYLHFQLAQHITS